MAHVFAGQNEINNYITKLQTFIMFQPFPFRNSSSYIVEFYFDFIRVISQSLEDRNSFFLSSSVHIPPRSLREEETSNKKHYAKSTGTCKHPPGRIINEVLKYFKTIDKSDKNLSTSRSISILTSILLPLVHWKRLPRLMTEIPQLKSRPVWDYQDALWCPRGHIPICTLARRGI